MTFLNSLALATTLTCAAAGASAATLNIQSVDNGWYQSAGTHPENNDNIITGYGGNYHNFFVFDLGAITGTVLSATLTIFGGNGDYFNTGSSATYSVFDVVTSISALMGGTGGTAAHADLGSGLQYGSATVATPNISGTMPEVTVDLAGGLRDLNAGLGGMFALGGSTNASTYLWGFSGYTPFQPAASLTLETTPASVPLPPALILLLAGLGGLGALGGLGGLGGLGLARRRRAG